VLLAPQLANLGQVFQYIQEYTGIVSPGILAVFLLGLFYRKATNAGAVWGVLSSIVIALYFKVGPNGWLDSAFFLDLPFMWQMFWTCLLTMGIIAGVSYVDGKKQDQEGSIVLSRELFSTSRAFNASAAIILLVLVVLYAAFW